MTATLYGHPFSSFTEKVLTALYESETPFTFRIFGPDDPEAAAEWEALSPMKRFPVLVDGRRTLIETSIIIEHLAQTRPRAAALIPADPAAALEVRLMDRMFDSYVMTPMLALAFNESQPADARVALGAERLREQLDSVYAWLDGVVTEREWAAGPDFSLADCAAAPALMFANWARPIPERLPGLHAYRRRLLARPSFARVVEAARRYRAAFPFPTSD